MPNRKRQRPNAPIEYVAPSKSKLRRYAKSVCIQLAETNRDFENREVLEDLTRLIQTVVEIQVAALNEDPTRFDNVDRKE